MKSFFVLCLAVLASLTACQSRKTTDTTHTADTVATQPAGANAARAAPLSPRLQALGLNAAHDWQQVSLGDNFAALKAGSQTEPFEQDAQHVGYSIDFKNLESIDYQYFQANGKVNKIQVDLYLNTAQNVAAYQKDLTDYFNGKYGGSAPIAQTASWQQGKVTLKNVSKGKDYGLQLVVQ